MNFISLTCAEGKVRNREKEEKARNRKIREIVTTTDPRDVLRCRRP